MIANMDDRTVLLLKEYELCQSSAKAFEAPIWQIGAVLGFGSLGSIALITSNSMSLKIELIVAIGVVVSILSILWWKMATRWWSIQNTEFLRIKHIEKDIGTFLHNQYIRRRDEKKQFPNDPELWPPIEGVSEERLREIDNVRHHAIYGTRHYSGWIVIINILAWFFVVSYRSAFLKAIFEGTPIIPDNTLPIFAFAGALGLFYVSDELHRIIDTRNVKNRRKKTLRRRP
jgi:hypothetical protein